MPHRDQAGDVTRMSQSYLDKRRRPDQSQAMNQERSEPGSLSIAAISLSCLGALSFGLLAIPGVICGHMARGKSPRDHALAGAALIIGYVVLGVFVGLPLLAFVGLALLSMSIRRDVSQEFSARFPDFGVSTTPRLEEESGASSVLNSFAQAQNGSFLILVGLFVLAIALMVSAPRIGRWYRQRQFRKVVAMNRSR